MSALAEYGRSPGSTTSGAALQRAKLELAARVEAALLAAGLKDEMLDQAWESVMCAVAAKAMGVKGPASSIDKKLRSASLKQVTRWNEEFTPPSSAEIQKLFLSEIRQSIASHIEPPKPYKRKAVHS